MTVILTPLNGDEEDYFVDVAAVVIEKGDWVRLCWNNRREDRVVSMDEFKVVVVQ